MSAITFDELAEDNPQAAAWFTERERAQVFVEGLNASALSEAVCRELEKDFKASGRLRAYDDLQALGKSVLASVGIRDAAWTGPRFDEVITALISRGMSVFLGRESPHLDRLEFVARVERYVDNRLIARLVAAGPKGAEWGSIAQKLGLDVHTLNDDEYFATDEIKRWERDRKRIVPRWQEGNFPHEGMSKEALLAEIIRASDEQAWLQFLDRLPLPSLMEALLYETDIRRSPAPLLRWIAKAPRVYEDDGSRNESALAFILERRARRAIEDHLLRRFGWGRGDADADSLIAEMEVVFEQLAHAIASRPDGKGLLVELAAGLLLQAQGTDGQPIAALRQKWHYALALQYCRTLGAPEEVLAVARARAAVSPDRGRWGLWLLVAVRAEPKDSERNSNLMREHWVRLCELMIAKDPELTERYSPPAQWSERLAALALCCCDDPVAELHKLWVALAPQRLARPSDTYSDDRWTTSLLLCRIGFLCAYFLRDSSQGRLVWSPCMEIALSGWFARRTDQPFAAALYGAAVLALGHLDVPDEPGRTYSYLIGELEEANELTIVLLQNGASSESILSSAREHGLDPVSYLALNSDKRKSEAVKKALDSLAAPPR